MLGEMSRLLFALSLCTSLVLTSSQSPENSCPRSPDPQTDRECSTVRTGDCLIQEEPNADPENILEDRPPEDNSRSRFRTCTGTSLVGDTCEADRIRFENNTLNRLSGPRNTSMYSYFKVFSRQFQNQRPYPPNEFALYNIFCNSANNPDAEDTVLSVALDTHDLQPPTDNPSCFGECVDYINFNFPIGQTCRTCGSELDMRCEELLQTQSSVKTLDRVHHFDGQNPFTFTFRSNRVDQPRFAGFQFLSSCVEKRFFCFENCSTPDRGRITKRSSSVSDLDKLVPTLVRGRRSYRLVHIIVKEDAAMSYSDYTIRVFRDTVWLYKFPNTRIFQVYNFIEGFQTFSRNAFTFSRDPRAEPVIRNFPGYGILKIGRGIIQYIQTGVDPRFLPSPAETEVILRLRRRIIFDFIDDEDPLEPDERGELIPDPIRRQREFTAAEIAQMTEEALTFGGACNGILRADACLYQELFLGGISDDCLEGVGMP